MQLRQPKNMVKVTPSVFAVIYIVQQMDAYELVFIG